VKAVVLAAGRGTRMQKAMGAGGLTAEQAAMADAGLKAMMPFGGRPFLDYVLRAIADAGGSEVCLIVAPGHNLVRTYYTATRPPRRLRVSFAVQHEPRGTAEALLAAESFVGRDAALVVNSDNYYPTDVLRTLAALDGQGLPAFSREGLFRDGLIEPARVRDYALLRIRPDGTLEDIVEKPDPATASAMGQDAFVSMNCWRLDARIFEACRRVPPSPRGELELPTAVRVAVQELRMRFTAFRVDAPVLDLSRRSDVPAIARRLAALEAEP
jgi:glucose-1-phosphate thymidylyltransferase